MAAEYIRSLREHYVKSVINAMMFEALQRGELAFTKCYALLSLLKLHEDYPKKKDGFSFKDIAKQAENDGYKATEQGIKGGLDALHASGIVIKSGRLYRLHPRFKIEVGKVATDIRKAISGAR